MRSKDVYKTTTKEAEALHSAEKTRGRLEALEGRAD